MWVRLREAGLDLWAGGPRIARKEAGLGLCFPTLTTMKLWLGWGTRRAGGRHIGTIRYESSVSRRPCGAADLLLRLTQDCVRWRELVLG